MDKNFEKDLNFAVLIDADNIASKYVRIILDEISNEGTATYKRIYGDWTSSNLSHWKSVLLENSITPIQQYSYTTGKSSTDSAMIIDAMDILYSGKVEGFCIVSSDSDFTRLAVRLRESGMKVIGMGEDKTPKPFIAACNQFKYLDKIFLDEKNASENKVSDIELRPVLRGIKAIINDASDDDGWIFAGTLGSLMVKRFPDFDVRNFGYSKMTLFLQSLKSLEIKRIANGDNHMVYVRNKPKKR